MDIEEKADLLFSSCAGDVPGASFVVIEHGKLALKKSYGLAELPGVRSTSSTNYRLASVTKAFTAMCVLKLIEAGKLSLCDRLHDLLPAMPDYTRSITIRQMLGHTSGLGDYETDVPESYPGQVHEDYVIEKVRGLPSTIFPPGSRFQYSDTAYVLLGTIVEVVSGVLFPRFVEKEIFRPLGMIGSKLYEGEGVKIRNRAFGYTRYGSAFTLNDQSKTSATLGDGCVYSSIDDLVKWDAALGHCGLVRGDLLDAAFSAGRLTDGTPTEYGYGWFITGKGKLKILHHAGETAGFQHKFIRVPDEKISLIILTNRDSYDLTLPRQSSEARDTLALLAFFGLI